MGSDELEKHIGSEATAVLDSSFYQQKLDTAQNEYVRRLYNRMLGWHLESAQLRGGKVVRNVYPGVIWSLKENFLILL